MCLCGNGVEDNEHFLLHCKRLSLHRTSYLYNVSHLINRSTIILSNSLLCNILLFGDNQSNDITNMLILEPTEDFCKKLGDSSAFLRCLIAISDSGNSSLKFTSFFCYHLILFLILPACCCCCLILEILWLLPNIHNITVVTSYALNITRVAASDFQC